MPYRKVLNRRPQKLLKSEELIQIQLADYMRGTYGNLIFRSDVGAGVKLTKQQAIKFRRMQSGRAYPDVRLDEARGGYFGLYLELKKEGTQLKRTVDARKILKGEFKLRRAGDWWDAHIEEQAAVLAQLQLRGYAAYFVVGFDQARQVIDRYMALKVNVAVNRSSSGHTG